MKYLICVDDTDDVADTDIVAAAAVVSAVVAAAIVDAVAVVVVAAAVTSSPSYPSTPLLKKKKLQIFCYREETIGNCYARLCPVQAVVGLPLST